MEFKQERNSDQATLPDNTVAQKVNRDSEACRREKEKASPEKEEVDN